jgi:hypothetical protein
MCMRSRVSLRATLMCQNSHSTAVTAEGRGRSGLVYPALPSTQPQQLQQPTNPINQFSFEVLATQPIQVPAAWSCNLLALYFGSD